MDRPSIIRVGTIASTQDAARELAIGSVVVAEQQTAGRGRLNRRWEAPPGTALLASFVVAPHPLLSLAAGVAAAEACGPGARLKWPNDVLIDGRKAGGILVEMSTAKAIVGVGVNLTWAPPGAARVDQPRDVLLDALIERLGAWTSAPPAAVARRWRELSDTLGRRVRVELAGRVLEGMAQDIAEDGSLIVDGERVSAGDVIHLRAAADPLG
jgi:BirA family biotin operon repressor/biotin-[acetyl-CoA-carboxylase] ligase